MNARKPTLYWEYIKVEELLALQNGLAETDAELSNDEVMFIVVHQVDELWFKLVLRELVRVRDLLARPHVPEQDLGQVVRSLRRVVVLFEQLSSHFALMETLTTRDYLAFRDKLSPASGFQSAGLREIEIVLGLQEDERIPLGFEGSYRAALHHPTGERSPALDRVEAREQDPITLREALNAWLWRTPIQGSVPGQGGDAEAVEAFLTQYLGAVERESRAFTELARRDAMTAEDEARLEGRHERGVAGARSFLFAEDAPENERERTKRLRAALLFIESYRELPLLSWPREVIDAVVAMEQAMLIFRSRHARMVERVIGRRTGTGGSAGVDYLDQTALKYRVFKNLWAVRTLLLREEALPELSSPHFYDFHPDAKLTPKS